MWIQVLILFAAAQRRVSRAHGPFEPDLKPMPPKPLIQLWGHWKFSRHRRHFIHMTAELLKDVTYKLRLSERYVEMHKGAINYELGFIAAAVHERFRNMIYLYRKYSRPLLNKTYNPFKPEVDVELENIVMALNLAHGDYNQILYERKTFYKLLREHEAKKGNTISMFDKNKKRRGRRSFPNVSDILTMVPESAKNMENTGETTESMKNTPLTDEEYKRRLRSLKYDKIRANFSPEIEGIDIDLDYF